MVSLSSIEPDTLRHCSIFSSSSMHLSHMLSPVCENSLPPTDYDGVERPFHRNAIMIPIPTRVYKLVTVTPRQSAMMPSDGKVELFAGHCTSPRGCLP
jgi:hypothetical protein